VIEKFKTKHERKTESSGIYFRAITRPLSELERGNEEACRIYEEGWKLQLENFFKVILAGFNFLRGKLKNAL
jgi:hypothetical protein